ncbi:MAG: dockerin type I repeat-containing protein, partial [Candidatus Zixiibacteriota bacterium]
SCREDNCIITLADTLAAGDAQGDPGETVEVILRARNTVPLNKLRIPVEYSGILGLVLDSTSVAGCRTESFDHVDTVGYEPVQRRIYIRVSNDYGSSTPDLEPGDGPVLKLYFTISPSAPHGYPNTISLDGYSSFVPRFEGPYVGFVPADLTGTVSLIGICGDANNDEAVNILDVTFIVNFLYKNGPDPDNPDLVDVNSDDAMNILDVTYIVNYLYKNGPDPSCL